jgi:hypothetical protein
MVSNGLYAIRLGFSPFFYHVIQYFHHCSRLLLGEAFALQALDELEGIKMVIASPSCRGMERARERWRPRGDLLRS